MSEKVVVGVYDSLAKAERAELHLGDVHLPVGKMSLISAEVEAGKVHGNITAREVAQTLASAGVQPTKEQIAGYEEALKEGKLLLLFRGDDDLVVKAYRALGNTDNDELTMLDE